MRDPDPNILADLNFLFSRYASEKALRTLKLTATQIVPGNGPLDGTARLLFVGEAPGRDEDKEGVPFVGRSGRFLDELIESLWLRRDEVYVTNVVKYRPMANRDPEPEEIKASLPYLRKEIWAVTKGKPCIIVGLGRVACAAIHPAAVPIGQTHGTLILLKNSYRLFCSYHPSWAIRTPVNKSVMFRDFEKLRRHLDDEEHT
jgi:uracil-DNA glycosylase family 4